MMETSALLFSAYLPPIQYFSKLVLHNDILIEQYEHYHKQTYRNRCQIQTSNGLLTLTIPIKGRGTGNQAINEVEIAYDEDWQRLHWRSICTAYRCSPFFEYYEDAFAPFYAQRWALLAEYNQQLLETLCKCIKLKPTFTFTKEYNKECPPSITDYREIIHPKASKVTADIHFTPQTYTQVFADKLGFMPNLSILDLLCNEGPHSTDYLKSCISA